MSEEPMPKVQDGTLYPLIWAKANGYMTGQEWYDRFMQSKIEALDSLPPELLPVAQVILGDIQKAAKRAAGIL